MTKSLSQNPRSGRSENLEPAIGSGTCRKRSTQKGLLLVGLPSLLALLLLYAPASAKPNGLFGIGEKTLGGRFVWSDEVVSHEWRVQKHAVIGHHRLIDPEDKRYTFGTLDHCLTELAKIKREEQLPPMPKEIVIVLHGLGASRQMMNGLCYHLEDEGDFSVVNVGYASTLGKVGDHAASLGSVIKYLHADGVETISFVAHSMGNLVIRHALYDLEELPEAERPKVKFKRFVMISAPNHGAAMADGWVGNKLAQLAAGEPLEELAPGHGWQALEQHLMTPDFEFGILSGGRGDDEGFLHAIPGDDDGLLTIKTNQLVGASDFAQVLKGVHQLMPQYKQVREYTLRYLQKGYFISARAKHPILQ